MSIVYPITSGTSIDSSDVTTTKDKVLEGSTYLGADTNDDVGTGKMPNRTGTNANSVAWEDSNENMSLKGLSGFYGSSNENGDYTIKLSSSKANAGLGITPDKILQGKSIGNVSGLATSDANATPNQILNGVSGYVKGVKVVGNIASLGGQNLNSQTYVQTIPSNGKYMTGDIILNGASLPPADALKKGYRYWIGSNYVDGTYQGYTDSPLYIFNSGSWGGGSGGYKLLSGGDINILTKSERVCMTNTGVRSSNIRTTNAINLSGYRYLHSDWIVQYYGGTIGICDATGKVILSKSGSGGANDKTFRTISLDISSLSGYYYVYVNFSYGTYNDDVQRTFINTLYLTAN